LGEASQGFRDKIVIASKFGFNVDLESGPSTRCCGGGRSGPFCPTCRELGIGFVPFAPSGYGFLTGAIDADTTFAAKDYRAGTPRMSPENLPHKTAVHIGGGAGARQRSKGDPNPRLAHAANGAGLVKRRSVTSSDLTQFRTSISSESLTHMQTFAAVSRRPRSVIRSASALTRMP